MCYETATFWKEYTISIKSFELSTFEDNTNVKSVDYWLKYHRMLKNTFQNLAQYFNLSTKYFYDEYLENTDELHEKLINYRKNNNLNIKEAAELIGVAGNTC